MVRLSLDLYPLKLRSSMRRRRRPALRAASAGGAANVYAAVFRMGMTKRSPSYSASPERRHRAQGLRPRHERRRRWRPGSSTISCRLWRKAHRRARQPQGSHKPESGENPGQETPQGTDPAAIEPGLQPHREAISKLESALRNLAERTVVGLLAILGGLRRSLQAGRMRKLFRGLRV